jgi:DNA-binding NarL/FixJ family response regulator
MDAPDIKIILVEDHEVFRSLYKSFIEQIEMCRVVAEADNGRQALSLIQSVPADLIVLDLSLPGLNGIDVLKKSKEICATKILVVTVHNDKEIIQAALDAGADGVCNKTIGPRLMAKAVVETVNGKHPVYLDSE